MLGRHHRAVFLSSARTAPAKTKPQILKGIQPKIPGKKNNLFLTFTTLLCEKTNGECFKKLVSGSFSGLIGLTKRPSEIILYLHLVGLRAGLPQNPAALLHSHSDWDRRGRPCARGSLTRSLSSLLLCRNETVLFPATKSRYTTLPCLCGWGEVKAGGEGEESKQPMGR